MGARIIWLSLLLAGPVWADDIIVCDPTDALVPNRVVKYLRSEDPVKSGATTDPNALIYSLPPSTVRPWSGVTPGGEARYWKCAASDVVAMSQAEKDALDAPVLAAEAAQQAFTTELSTNDFCNKELADYQALADTWLADRQAALDAASTNAQVKAVLRDEFYPAVASAFLKVMKCVRSHAR